MLCAELNHVDDEPQMRFGRVDPLLLCDVLLQDVVLERAPEIFPVDALFFSGDEEKSK